MKKFHLKGLWWAAVSLLLAGHASAQRVPLIPQDCRNSAGLGDSVAVSGRWAFIGAPSTHGPTDQTPAGAVFVFEFDRNSWQERQTLRPSTHERHYFGKSVAAYGDVAVIGQGGPVESESGFPLAYVFRFDGSEWVAEQVLYLANLYYDGLWGAQVATDGSTIFIGTPWVSPEKEALGSVHVFRFDGAQWQSTGPLTRSSDAETSQRFGTHVAVRGKMGVVGVLEENNRQGVTRSRYFTFRLDPEHARWSIQQELPIPSGFVARSSGGSVSILNDTILVGAHDHRATAGGPQSGVVHVFRFNGSTWERSQRLLPDHAYNGQQFGSAISLSEEQALIGASGDREGGEGAGAVYTFQHCPAGFFLAEKIMPPRPGRIGRSVSLEGSIAIAGAPATTQPCGLQSGGAAYAIPMCNAQCNANGFLDACLMGANPINDCNGDGILDSCEITFDQAIDCDSSGVPDACELPPLCAHCIDCNGNGVVDTCDVTEASSLDCNADSIPDECQVPPSSASCPDCNANAVPDECDIAAGTSMDCSDNGIPDECEPDCNGDGLADVCERQMKLLPADRKAHPNFGKTMAIVGDVAIIGAPEDSRSSQELHPLNVGSAFIFRAAGPTWTLEQKIEAPDGRSQDRFGSSVAGWAEWVAVGAPGFDLNGAVHLFRFNGLTWDWYQKLTAPNPQPHDWFGYSVAMGSRGLIIGGFLGTPDRAYAFRFDGSAWVFHEELLPWLPEAMAFGGRLVVHDDHCFISGRFTTDQGTSSGVVFAYRFNGRDWLPQQVLSSDNPSSGIFFGNGLALSAVCYS